MLDVATLTREPGQDFDPSLVHPLETSVDVQLPLSYQDYKAAHHVEEFRASLDLYVAIDRAEGTFRAERFLECRQWAWFARHEDTGMVRVMSNSCHLRWCPMCAEAKAGMIAGNVKDWLKFIHKPKFLTLTVISSNEPLQTQITRLYKQFRKFRQNKLVKAATRGGVWFFQITYRPKTKKWHPHLHCILDANYISHRVLSQEWLAATGNSFIVDIRAVKNPDKAAFDVARYSSRPCSLAHFKDIDTTEIFSAFHGKRLCGSFGTGRGILLRPKKDEEWSKWQRLPSWQVVIANRDDGGAFQAVLKAWLTNTPVAADVIGSLVRPAFDENTVETFHLTINQNKQGIFEEFR